MHLLPFLAALLAALGWTGLRARRAADVQAGLRPVVARPSPTSSLCFEPPRVELGRLAPEARREVSVAWRWEGATPCRVVGVDSTCGCVVAGDLPGEVAPSAAGTLALLVHAPTRPGPFRAAVKVWLHPSSGDRPPTLEVRGHVGSPLGIRPEELALGRRTAGTRVARHLDLEVVPALGGAAVTATLEGLAGSVAVEPAAFAGRPGASLRLGVRVPDAPGPFAGRVVVRVAGEPRPAVVALTGEAVVRR